MSCLRLTGLLKRGLRLGEDVAEDARLLAEGAQHVDVVVGQRRCRFRLRSVGQSQSFGQLDAALVGHLEEQQVGDLLDVVAVVDAVVAQGVAEAPEFLDDVGHSDLLLIGRFDLPIIS